MLKKMLNKAAPRRRGAVAVSQTRCVATSFLFFCFIFSFRLQTTADVESRSCVIYVNNLHDDLDHNDEKYKLTQTFFFSHALSFSHSLSLSLSLLITKFKFLISFFFLRQKRKLEIYLTLLSATVSRGFQYDHF